MTISRRTLLATGAAAILAPNLPRAAPAIVERRLIARPARASMVGPSHPDTEIWSYGGSVPGPEIRLRQGDRLRVVVENQIAQETSIHWHGVRLPNAMDGVPHVTQPPIAPGGSFVYDFTLPDAGTYWYHPHWQSFEQVGRGLYGALIVEEITPLAVDRDMTWVLGDWRLLPDASIAADFGNFHDISHAGRIGNTVTLNGRVPETFAVRAGERLRLRLINVANARIFGLEFAGHRPRVIALDGQPVEPHEPDGGRIVLGPGMRADIVIDVAASPGERFTVTDRFYRGREYRLVDLACANEAPIRARPLASPIRLPDNPLSEPDLNAATRHEMVFGGGMMGGVPRGRTMDDMRQMMQQGLAWTINGIAASGHAHEPLLTLERNRSYLLALENDTAWHHPIHLHGHAFRVLSRNGQPTQRREWQDSVLLAPRETAEIAFVADNQGDWMLHCHVLEHQAGGLMGVIRVA